MRNAQRRDDLRDRYNLIGLEMEAAGVMNSLPTGVIRGVCDYGDQHKEKSWQPYAAAVAAVYAKGILCTINPAKADLDPVNPAQPLAPDEKNELDPTDKDILTSLAFPQMIERRIDVQEPHRNTCRWIFDRPEYHQWSNQPNGLLWIKGKPGAGKSTLMSFLYDFINNDVQHEYDVRLDFFFSARGTELQHTFLGMLRSIINQLYHQDARSRAALRKYYETKCAAFGQQQYIWEWRLEELKSLFHRAVITSAKNRQVLIFVDALDEAGEQAALEIAEYLHSINDEVAATSATAKVCISSRHYPIASVQYGLEISVENYNLNDIKAFIDDRLRSVAPHPNDHEAIKELIQLKQDLLVQTDGVFQWIHLVVPTVVKYLRDGLSLREARNVVQKVPQAIGNMYEHILRNVVSDEYFSRSFILFQWACLGQSPLSVDALRYAMAAVDAVPQVHGTQRVRCKATTDFVRTTEAMELQVKALSGGLLEVAHGCVQVVHQTVKEFLLKQGFCILASLAAQSHTNPPAELFLLDSETINSAAVISECHSRLYWSCLKYLSTEAPSEFSEDKFERCLEFSAFSGYAVRYILVHAQAAGGRRGPNTAEQVDLLERVVNFWTWAFRKIDLMGPRCPRPSTTLLHAAASANLADIVAHLSLDVGNLHARDSQGMTPLHAAARWGNLDAVQVLVEMGADVNAKSDEDQTPLVVAAANGHPIVIRWMLDHGADLEYKTGSSGNALQAACRQGQADIVFLLLEANADPNAHTGHFGSALQAAAAQGNEHIVEMLLDKGAEVDAQGGHFGTALQAAAWRGREHIVQLLIQRGAKVNTVSGEYGTALQAASRKGWTDTVELLLHHGALVNGQHAGFYGTALQAAAAGRSISLVELLLKHRANVNAHAGHYGTALHAAASLGESGIVRILLDAGADVNDSRGSRGTPLQIALQGPHRRVRDLLLERRANLNIQD